ncbi:MAG: hypothetical protein PHD54_08935 [Desulfuromonadaceae bacterium]|nr:hypothetical protein [Desulfuromonadaceae bacterium]
MKRIVAMVILGCCSLVCLLIAIMSFGEQEASALMFAALGAYFGYQAVSTLRLHLRQKGASTVPPEKQNMPQITFVPHWFIMAALGVTVLVVVGSILWKFIR